jgi:hypothetical protein
MPPTTYDATIAALRDVDDPRNDEAILLGAEDKRDFARACFDANGELVLDPVDGLTYVSIDNVPRHILDSFARACPIPHTIRYVPGGSRRICFSGSGAVEFCDFIYKDAVQFDLCKKIGFMSLLHGDGPRTFAYVRTIHDAPPPSKAHATDSGYDLHLVAKVSEVGNVVTYSVNQRSMKQGNTNKL